MTKIEEAIIRYITNYYRKNKFYPSYDEIADGVSKAKATVYTHMEKLKDEGIIVRKSDRSSQYRLLNMDFICRHESMESCSTGRTEQIDGLRYKLTHRHDWEIVDTKAENRLVVYSIRSHEMAESICGLLNEGRISVDQLHHEMCYPTGLVEKLTNEVVHYQWSRADQ